MFLYQRQHRRQAIAQDQEATIKTEQRALQGLVQGIYKSCLEFLNKACFKFERQHEEFFW